MTGAREAPEGGEGAGVKRLVDIQAVADALGVKACTIYNMVSRREIPFTKVGRLTKFDPEAIDAWLAQHSFSPLRRPGAALKPTCKSPLTSDATSGNIRSC